MNEGLRLTLPLDDEKIMKLKCGDRVLLNGYVYTARDAAHKMLTELLESGKPLPVDLKNETLYYVGPTDSRNGFAIGSAGPTSSGRMDKFTPALLDLGLKGMIGKGKRSKEVIDSIKKNRCVYFVAVGGIGALLAQRITECKEICFPELHTESIKRLCFCDFPCIVAIDAFGKNIYDCIK